MSDNAKQTKNNRRALTAAIIAGVGITALAIGGYSLGYRFGGPHLIGKRGHVSFSIPRAGTAIYIDKSEKITTAQDNQQVSLALSQGTHLILVGRDGYYPWAKEVRIESDKTIDLMPMFVTQNTTGQIITARDPEYWKIRGQVEKTVLATKTNPRVSADQNTRVWVEDNTIIAEVAGSIHTVISPEEQIKNVEFYKGRPDVVIFSAGNGIYAIEIDTSGTQNFMPIYKGTDPRFIETSPDYIYAIDGQNLLAIVL